MGGALTDRPESTPTLETPDLDFDPAHRARTNSSVSQADKGRAATGDQTLQGTTDSTVLQGMPGREGAAARKESGCSNGSSNGSSSVERDGDVGMNTGLEPGGACTAVISLPHNAQHHGPTVGGNLMTCAATAPPHTVSDSEFTMPTCQGLELLPQMLRHLRRTERV